MSEFATLKYKFTFNTSRTNSTGITDTAHRTNSTLLNDTDKVLLKRMPHRFTRMVPGMKHLPYLTQLGLWTLEERRHCADLLEVFRMYKGLSLTPFCRFFILSPVNNTRGHSAKVLRIAVRWI